MKKYTIEVETLNEGQPRPYADSEWKYKISYIGEDIYHRDKLILNFCTKVLFRCNKKYDDDREWFEQYYSLDKIQEEDQRTTYLYTVHQAYLD